MSSFFQKLALGTVQFGLDYGISNNLGQTPIVEVEKILNYAYQKGIKTLDTAYAYGSSETVLGQLHKDRFDIVTKFMPESDGASIQAQFEISLGRLSQKKIYGYLSHRPLDLLENIHVWRYLLKLKEEEKISKIGFSLNHPNEYILLKQNGFIPDLVQFPFNYFDNRFLKIIDDLKEIGCEIHTRSTFLQGLFFMNPIELSQHFSQVKQHISGIQEACQSDLAKCLLKYVIEQDFIDKVVIGVQNLNQLIENTESLNTKMSLKRFSGHIDDSILQPSNWVL